MNNFSIIQKSQLEGAVRIDAEYYQPEFFIDLTRGKWKSIGDILKKCQYGLSLAMNDKEKGYPMFKMDNIEDTFLFDDKVRFADVSEKEFENFQLEKNDVLFNRVNSEEFVGRTGIYKLDLKSTFASYLIRLQPDKEEILPDYLNIFINSKFGLRQIKKYARRAVNQANVNAEELKQFKIAILPMAIQKEIEKLSNEAWNKIQDSKLLYQQAENLFLEELGLKDFDNEEKLSSIVNFSEIESIGRMDAEYFQSKYIEVINKIEKYKGGCDFIKNQFKQNKKIAKRDKEFFNYVEISDVNILSGEIVPTKINLNDIPANGKIKLFKNDLLISKVRPYRGAVSYIDFEMDNLLGSGAFTVLQEKNEYKKEVLMIFLKTNIIKELLLRYNCGTSYPVIKDEDILNLKIPILSKEIQLKISELVQKSHIARKKSKELLEDAKKKVEEMIEFA